MKIVSRSLIRAIMGALGDTATAAGKLTGLYVGLITSPVGGLSSESAIGDVTEAAYTGYARQAVGTWGAAYDTPDGKVNLEAPTLLFQPSDAAVPETITGVAYFSASTAGTLVGVDPLPEPYPLPDEHSGLAIAPHASLPFTTDMGSSDEVV